MYREPVNSPFVPQIQKDIISQENPQPVPYKQVVDQQFPPKKYPPRETAQAGNPVVDLKVWQPKKPPTMSSLNRDKIPPVMFMPIPGQTPYFPPQFNNMWPYFYNPQVVSPVVKQFSINNGPFVNYSTLSVVKEDALPPEFTNTANTLGERLNLHNFVRSVFIKHHDGEDIDLDGKGKNSLLSYLKFMELNPYSTTNSNNPYKGLPDGMIIYRSCYPIRYDETSNMVQCAPNSIGMNIRIYKLTNAEYNIKKQSLTKFHEYDVWREIAYYEYIREQIIKRKICPNFIMLYGYYISEKCNVDFDKIKLLREKESSLIPDPIKINLSFNKQDETIINPSIKKTFINTVKTLDDNSGKGIVALTEGPTYSIYGWSSKTYLGNGNVHRMVNTGYHTSEVWMSILFQLITGLYTLQLHGIVFSDFSLQNNVYIKDISQHENIVMHWKYKINEFEYYVPNYGYLLLIDSNYKDIKQPDFTLKVSTGKTHKIHSNIFKDGVYDQTTINNLAFDTFLTAFNPNSFDKSFTNFGGTKPPSDILDLIKRIHSDASSQNANKNIGHYIYTYMGTLLNNRVGTYLTELELKNVRKDDAKPFKPGQIVIHEVQNETYKFVIFVNQNNNMATILTKEDPSKKDIIESVIPKDSLFSYSRYDNVVQNYRPNVSNLNEDELLETYVVSK
ncbi:hypothetical protein Indivirus_4_43 [Indivirus ILV1]|uniref:Protein kinase domain-containing protein n=1 Tax=Indivirus ILV1 TaxID=1977633 RepID=A0A1V0SDV4_9VIRU|nr:hypothetical protein Indivirus_4_43 [Indivirus ILV1]